MKSVFVVLAAFLTACGPNWGGGSAQMGNTGSTTDMEADAGCPSKSFKEGPTAYAPQTTILEVVNNIVVVQQNTDVDIYVVEESNEADAGMPETSPPTADAGQQPPPASGNCKTTCRGYKKVFLCDKNEKMKDCDFERVCAHTTMVCDKKDK